MCELSTILKLLSSESREEPEGDGERSEIVGRTGLLLEGRRVAFFNSVGSKDSECWRKNVEMRPGIFLREGADEALFKCGERAQSGMTMRDNFLSPCMLQIFCFPALIGALDRFLGDI